MKQLLMEEKDYGALNHVLPNTDFFSALTGGEIEKLVQSIELVSFEPGEYIFKQGSRGDALFIVYEGEVAVRIRKYFFLPEKTVVTLGPGQIFGEMALLESKPHSASVRAVTPVKLFVLLLSAFDLLFAENKVFREALRLISERRKFHNRHL